MRDVDALACVRERVEVPPPQAPASPEAAKVDAQRTIDRAEALPADHLRQACTLRPADLQREVRPAHANSLIQVFVADVDPAEKGYFVVDQQDFAMVAAKATGQQREQAVVDPDGAAGLAQRCGDGPPSARRAPAVDQHLHRHSPSGSKSQGFDEARAHPTRRKGVHLEVHAPGGARNGGEHARIGLLATVEQLDQLRGAGRGVAATEHERGVHLASTGHRRPRCGPDEPVLPFCGMLSGRSLMGRIQCSRSSVEARPIRRAGSHYRLERSARPHAQP